MGFPPVHQNTTHNHANIYNKCEQNSRYTWWSFPPVHQIITHTTPTSIRNRQIYIVFCSLLL